MLAKQAQLADGPHRHGEGGADRLLGPAAAAQRLDGAPLVHRPHLGALDVLGERAQRVGLVLTGRHDDVDLGQAGGDRRLDPALAGLDHQLAVELAHERRLDQADRLDVGGQRGVRLGRRLGPAGVVRVELQLLRVDGPEFHGVAPVWGSSSSPFLAKTPPGSRTRVTGAKAARHAPGSKPAQRSGRRRPTLCRGRVACGSHPFLRSSCHPFARRGPMFQC